MSPLLEAPSMQSAPSCHQQVKHSESPTPIRYRQETAGRQGVAIELDSNREEVTTSGLLGEEESKEWENYDNFFNGNIPYT